MHPSKQSLLVVFFRIKWDLKEVAREIALIYEATLAEFDNEALKVFNLRVGIVDWKTQIVVRWGVNVKGGLTESGVKYSKSSVRFLWCSHEGLV